MTDELSKREGEIVDGTVWNEFCDTLKMAGNVVMSPNAPSDPLNRMEGFRYLSRITGAALKAFVEHNDPLAPVLMRVVHETAKMGADHPDNYYQNASISGEHEYRIRGNRGTVHYLGFFTQIGNYGQSRGMPPSGYIEASSLEVDEDGSFEIIVSTEKKPGNWLPMKKETGTLIVRQTFLDRETEKLAELDIERIGGDGKPTPFDPVRCADGMQMSASLQAAHQQTAAFRSRKVKPGRRRSRHRLLPQLLEARAGRGVGHRGDAAQVRALELPAQQLLDGVTRLPVLPRARKQTYGPLSARWVRSSGRGRREQGVRQLDRYSRTYRGHDVLAVGPCG